MTARLGTRLFYLSIGAAVGWLSLNFIISYQDALSAVISAVVLLILGAASMYVSSESER